MKRTIITLLIVSILLLPSFSTYIFPVIASPDVQRILNFEGSFENEFGTYDVTVHYPSVRRSLFLWWSIEEPDRSRAPYPAVVFAHGLFACKEWYSWLEESLAKRGIIVLSFTVPDRGSLDVQQWVAGIEGGIEYLLDVNRIDDDLQGMVDVDRIGIIGHSMGGMATILVSASNPNVTVSVSLSAPYIIEPFEDELVEQLRTTINWDAVYNASKKIEIPIQYQIGTLDKFATGNSTSYYNVTPSENKTFIAIEGANHVQYLDDVTIWDAREYVTPLLQMIPSTGAGGIGNVNIFTLIRVLRMSIIEFAVSVGIDNPAQISTTNLHQISLENIFLWLETYL